MKSAGVALTWAQVSSKKSSCASMQSALAASYRSQDALFVTRLARTGPRFSNLTEGSEAAASSGPAACGLLPSLKDVLYTVEKLMRSNESLRIRRHELGLRLAEKMLRTRDPGSLLHPSRLGFLLQGAGEAPEQPHAMWPSNSTPILPQEQHKSMAQAALDAPSTSNICHSSGKLACKSATTASSLSEFAAAFRQPRY